jgi:N-acetylmuramoyl-L-alanine amidase CwlA
MNVIKNITTKVSIKCPYAMTPTRIVVHNTANDASARNEIAYMNSNDSQTSFHYAVDDIEVVQGIEENRNSWHAGDGAKGKGNREGIAIEICYSKSGGDKFIKAEQNAVHLIVDILKRYNWGIDKVTKHQDYSGKYCPHRTLDMGWDRFINMIKAEIEASKNEFSEEELLMIDDLTKRIERLEKEVFKSAEQLKVETPPVKPVEQPKVYSGSSIVDYLKSIGQDSSFKNRQALAKKYGIVAYVGLASQNSALLRKMRGF